MKKIAISLIALAALSTAAFAFIPRRRRLRSDRISQVVEPAHEQFDRAQRHGRHRMRQSTTSFDDEMELSEENATGG